MNDMTPEEFILQHARAPYDPVKAREYYLRTRHLKGRKAGSKTIGPGRRAAVRVVPKLRTQSVTQQRQKEVQARVKALEVKLDKLRAILAQLVNKAQGRTVRSADNKPLSKKASPAGSRKQTAAQNILFRVYPHFQESL